MATSVGGLERDERGAVGDGRRAHALAVREGEDLDLAVGMIGVKIPRDLHFARVQQVHSTKISNGSQNSDLCDLNLDEKDEQQKRNEDQTAYRACSYM